jgi:hypothetical protein
MRDDNRTALQTADIAVEEKAQTKCEEEETTQGT